MVSMSIRRSGFFPPLAVLLLFFTAVPMMTTQAAEDAAGLREVFELALVYDDAWSAAQARARAAAESYPIARAGLLPSLSATGTLGRTHRETDQAGQELSREYAQDTLRLQARQPLLNRERWMRVRMAQRDADIGGLELDLAYQDLIQRTVNAYLNLLQAQEQRALVQAEIDAIDAQMQQIKRMREGGVATVTDVYEAQARLDLARAREIEARNLQEIRRRELLKIIRQPVGMIKVLGEQAGYERPIPYDMDAWTQMASDNALEVQAQKLALERAGFNVDRARSQHLPTLDGVAAWERFGNSDLGYARDRYGRVSLELHVPLYMGGRISAETREARARFDQALDESELTRRESELKASSAFLELSSSLARIEALEQAVRSSEVALQASEISLSVAYRTFVDVLDAQQQLYRTRFDLLGARIEYVRAMVALNAAVGMLNEDTIDHIDTWMETF